MTKAHLRTHYQQLRRDLSKNLNVPVALCQHWPFNHVNALTIGSYLATPSECSTAALHALWFQQRHHVYIPLISTPKIFAELTPASVIITTTLGIGEPVSDQIITVDQLDILLLPLLAIDSQGYRLGRGGGFYDQLLAGSIKKPWLIGLGFHQQLCDQLPHDPWDIPVNAFLSEQGYFILD